MKHLLYRKSLESEIKTHKYLYISYLCKLLRLLRFGYTTPKADFPSQSDLTCQDSWLGPCLMQAERRTCHRPTPSLPGPSRPAWRGSCHPPSAIGSRSGGGSVVRGVVEGGGEGWGRMARGIRDGEGKEKREGMVIRHKTSFVSFLVPNYCCLICYWWEKAI